VGNVDREFDAALEPPRFPVRKREGDSRRLIGKFAQATFGEANLTLRDLVAIAAARMKEANHTLQSTLLVAANQALGLHRPRIRFAICQAIGFGTERTERAWLAVFQGRGAVRIKEISFVENRPRD